MQIERLGPYRIGPQLGRGGMGTVYAAVNTESNEPAAVKVLAAALGDDEAFRDRFEAEIETLRKLRHENIVRLHGYGEEQGVLFYVMELVVGASLEEAIRQGRTFHWREAVGLAVKLCGALKHAHDRGVVHRDIKPANLLLTASGDIKLSDFGIAKLFGATGLTASGGVVGTAEYMAPEQADGRPVSHRSDLYSLGAVLYTMLSGRPPFVAGSVPELLQMQRFASPDPLRRHAPHVPEEIESIVLTLLEKDPERRPANATLLARRLSSTAHGLAQKESAQAARAVAGGQTGGDDEFEVGSDEPSKASDPAGVTRVATEAERSGRGASKNGQESVDPLAATQVTDALRTQEPEEDPPAEPAAPGSRFTTVGEEDVGDDYYSDGETTWVSGQTLIWCLLLLALGFGAWWSLQPPAADKLYERVTEQVRTEGDEGALAAADDVDAFLRHYPNDPRSREMEQLLQVIELKRLERSYDLARRLASAQELQPVEIAFVEATENEQFDPPRTVAQLEALLDAYAGLETTGGKRERLCLRLAREKLKRLKPVAEAYVARRRQDLEKLLEQAETLMADDREDAKRRLRGLIALYGERAWAAPQVTRAREMLEGLSPIAPEEDPLDSSRRPEVVGRSSPQIAKERP